MPTTTGGAGGTVDESPGSTAAERTRRRLEYSPPQTYTLNTWQESFVAARDGRGGSIEGRIAAAEQATRQRLATELVWGLALQSYDDHEAARAGATIARMSQVPSMMTDNMGKRVPMDDPLTGEPMSWRRLKTARLLTQGEMAGAIAKAIGHMEEKGVRITRDVHLRKGGYVVRGEPVPVTAEDITQAAEALSPVRGHLDAETFLASAVGMAATGVDFQSVNKNLQVIVDWAGKRSPWTEEQMISLAISWSGEMPELITPTDIVGIVNPKLVELNETAERMRVPEDQAFPSIALAKAGAYQQADQYQKIRDAMDLALEGNGGFSPKWTQMAREAVGEMSDMQDTGFFGDVLSGGLEVWDQVIQDLGAIAYVPSIIGAAMGASGTEADGERDSLLQDLKEAVGAGLRQGGELWDVVTRERTIGSVVADDMGFAPGSLPHTIMDLGVNFAAGWFLDPLVIAGQAKRLAALKYVVEPTRAELKGLGIMRGFVKEGRTVEEVDRLLVQWADSTVPERVARALTNPKAPKGPMTWRQWLSWAGVEDIDLISAYTIGENMRGEGISRETGAFIHKWVNQERNGHITDDVAEEVLDIVRQSMGLPMSSAGAKAFEAYYMKGTEEMMTREIHEAVKRGITKTKPRFTKEGVMVEKSEIALRRVLSGELKKIGLSDAAVGNLVERTFKNLRPRDWDLLRSPERLQEYVDTILGGTPFAGGKLRTLPEAEVDAINRGLESLGYSGEALVRQRAALIGSAPSGGRKLVNSAEQDLRDRIIDGLDRLGFKGKRVGNLVNKITSWDLGEFTRLRNLKPDQLDAELRKLLGTFGKENIDQVLDIVRPIVLSPGGMKALRPDQIRALARSRGAMTWEETLTRNLTGVQRTIPHTYPGLEGAREMRLSIKDSAFWQGKMAQHFFQPVFERAPKPWMDIEDFAGDEMLGRILRSYGFADPAIGDLRAKFLRIQDAPVRTREAAFQKFIRDDVIGAYYRDKVKLPEALVDHIMDFAAREYKFANQSAKMFYGFAQNAAGEVVRLDSPPLETMLINVLLLPDAKQVELGIKRAFGSNEKLLELARRTIGTDDLLNVTDPAEWERLFEAAKAQKWQMLKLKGGQKWDTSLKFFDAIRNTWVSSVLLRVGWPIKVLGDENIRGIVTLHSFADKLAATRVWGKVGEKLHIFKPVILEVEGKAGAVEEITLQVPWHWSNEPAADQGMTLNSWGRSRAQEVRMKDANLRKLYEMIGPNEGERYWQNLHHMLANRIHQSEIGQRVLAYLSGDSINGVFWDAERLRKWAHESPIMREFAGGEGGIDDALDGAIGYVSYYTAGNRDVARKTIHGILTPEDLKAGFRGIGRDAPELFLREGEEASLFRLPVAAKLRDRLFDGLMRQPSSFLNRQPLYKALFSQELERLIKIERRSGTTFTKEMIAELEAGNGRLALRAKKYALNKELSVMFSYMNRSDFAEASRFIFPFFSAWEEQLTVWGKLAFDNPQIIGRARSLWNLAQDTGIVSKDPDTGMWVVDRRFLAGAIVVSTLFHPIGYLPAAVVAGGGGVVARTVGIPDVGWVYPLSGFNMFLSDSFNVSVGDTNIPLPFPGFSPVAQYMFQVFADKVYPDSWPGKERLMSFAFQYGPDPSIIPSQWERIISAVVGPIGSSELRRTENAMWDNAVYNGLSVSGLSDKELLDLKNKLHNQARQFMFLRGFLGFFNPVSPMVEWPVESVRDEFFADVDESDWDTAVKNIKAKYPNSPDILLAMNASTIWMGPLSHSPSLPTNEFVARMMQNPEFAEAAKDPTGMAFALWLIPKEFRDEDYDFDYNALSKQLELGMRAVREPALFDGPQLVGGRVYEYLRQTGWDQWNAAQETFHTRRVALGIPDDPDNNQYKDLWHNVDGKGTDMDEIKATLDEEYPPFAVESAQFNGDPRERMAVNMLREVTSRPGWNETGFGKAMQAYFAERDQIYAEMQAKNITNLTNAGAETAGIVKRYDALVADLTRQYGADFTEPYNLWLDHDLLGVAVAEDDPKIPPRIIAHNQNWQEKFDKWRDVAGGNFIHDWERNDAFHRVRELSIRAARWSEAKSPTHDPFDPKYNAQMSWWRHLGGGTPAQTEYAMQTAMKPYVFLSPFERNVVLDLPTTGENEIVWSELEARKNETYIAIAHGADEGDSWDKYNADAAAIIADHPGFMEEINRNGTWGFTLRHSIRKFHPAWMRGDEGEVWSAMFELLDNVKTVFKKVEFVSDDQMTKVKTAFEYLVEEYGKFSPTFEDHYKYLQDLAGGDNLKDTLIPDLWWIKV